MVLVDTSVWRRALAGREPFRAGLDHLLERDLVLGHELVYGELLIGDTGGRLRFLNDYVRQPQAARQPHQEVVDFVRSRRLHGQGVSWTDVQLLASALQAGCLLWTADEPLARLAQAVHVNYTWPA